MENIHERSMTCELHTAAQGYLFSPAQGMFWWKNINQIKGDLCPPLCHDPLRPRLFNSLSVEALPCGLRSPGALGPRPCGGPHSGSSSFSITALASLVAASMA